MFNANAFVKHKELPNFQSMFGNIGKSWENALPNDLYIKSVSKTILRTAPQIGYTGGGVLQTLHTFSLPGGSLKTVNDYLIVRYGIDFTANDNNKLVVAGFGGTNYEGGGALDIDGAEGAIILAQIYRLSDTQLRVNHIYGANTLFADSANAVNTFGSSGIVFSRDTLITVAGDLDTDAFNLTFAAQGSSNNDVIINTVVVELNRQ